MRLTNVLNVGLLAHVVVASLGGVLTWVGISTLSNHLEIAHVTEAITEDTHGLSDALRQFQLDQDDTSEDEVRRRLTLVNSGIAELIAADVASDTVGALQSAKQI